MSARALSCALLLCLVCRPAAAQPRELVVAVFAPNVYFPSLQARADLATRIAERLSTKLGRSARGVAFGQARDLESALARGDVDAAILDPVYVAGRASLAIVATARREGRAETTAIAVSQLPVTGIAAFRGKHVIVPRLGGAETRFLDHFVLESQSPARAFFSEITTAADAASAIAAVQAGQADLAIVLDSPEARRGASERGLHVGFSTRALPGPALAWLARERDPGVEAAVLEAARSAGASVAGDGWGAAGRYGEILAAAPEHRPLFDPPPPMPIDVTGVLALRREDVPLPAWPGVPMGSPTRLP